MALGDKRDLEETRVRLGEWLEWKLPHAKSLTVSELTTPTMGFSNETLLFDLVCHDGRGEKRESLVIRFAPENQVFPEYDLARQYRIMEQLAKAGIPVPSLRWYEPDAAALGAPFYVMERVEGMVPSDVPSYHAMGPCAEMTPASLAAIWWDGIEMLTRIHKVDWRALHLDFLLSPQWGSSLLEQQLNYYAHFLQWAANGKAYPVCDSALSWLRRHQPVDEPVGLCWGDARIGNMMFRDDRCVAVFDWEMASLGNPEQDLAWWLFFDWHHSEGVGVRRLDGFPTREETIGRYEELTGRKAENLLYYEIFAAFRFAVIMIRVAQLAAAAGMPAAPDMDSNNIPTQHLARLLELPFPS